MEQEGTEVECPNCERKIPAESKSCPACGADFTLSGMDELEALAKHMMTQGYDTEVTEVGKEAEKDPPEHTEDDEATAKLGSEGPKNDEEMVIEPPSEKEVPTNAAVEESPSAEEAPEEKKSGLFKRFFGKKK